MHILWRPTIFIFGLCGILFACQQYYDEHGQFTWSVSSNKGITSLSTTTMILAQKDYFAARPPPMTPMYSYHHNLHRGDPVLKQDHITSGAFTNAIVILMCLPLMFIASRKWVSRFLGIHGPIDQILISTPNHLEQQVIHTMHDTQMSMFATAGQAVATAGQAVTTTYNALFAKHTGSSFREVAEIRKIPMPELGPSEVLIKVTHAGVNGGCETFRARGEYLFMGNSNASDGFALGAEGVGIVHAVGSDVFDFQIGECVAFVGGAFAEYVKSPASRLWRIPEASAEAAAVRISGLTAYSMLQGTGRIQPGETVLVTAAGGAAGHFAVQVAKLAGCHVVGTCSSAAKMTLLKSLGCDRIINYKEEDVAEVLMKEYPAGVDVILEGVGGSMLQVALKNLAPAGRLLQIGYISEYPHNKDRDQEASKHGMDSAKLFWGSETMTQGQQTIYGNAWPRDSTPYAESVLKLFTSGQLKAKVDPTPFIGLESVSDAVDYMLTGQALGKVVVSFK